MYVRWVVEHGRGLASSLRFGSITVKATSKLPVDSSTPHPPSEIPAANEVAVHSSLPWVSCDVDFFDPIASELQAVPSHERWDTMRSKEMVVTEKPSGMGSLPDLEGRFRRSFVDALSWPCIAPPMVGNGRGRLRRIRRSWSLSC